MSSEGGGSSNNRNTDRGTSMAKKSRADLETVNQSAFDTALLASCHLLDSKILLQVTSLKAGSIGPCVKISTSEVPVPSTDPYNINFKSLYRKCLANSKKDRIQFNAACFMRADSAIPDPTWHVDTWNSLARCVKETSIEMVLNFIIEDSESKTDQDLMELMTSLYGGPKPNSSTNVALVGFVERLSDWSQEEKLVPPAMAQRIFSLAKTNPLGRAAVIKMVKSGGLAVSAVVKIDEVLMSARKVLEGLVFLFEDASVLEILSQALCQEVEQAKNGEYFMTNSIFSGLLSVSMAVDQIGSVAVGNPKYSCFVDLRSFPDVSSADVNSCFSHLQDAFHRIHRTIHSALLRIIKSDSKKKDIVLTWLAAVVSLNEVRAGPRFKKERQLQACSDGFMINFCTVLLTFCKPFFSRFVSAPKLDLISLDYPSSPVCRLDHINVTCLASGTIDNDRTSEGHIRFRGLPRSFDGGQPAITRFKFVTEIFFITQRALHVGLIPAVNGFTTMASNLSKEIQDRDADERLKRLSMLYQLAWSCCLMDPQFVQMCCDFYITQAVWITKQMEGCQQEGVSDEELCQKQHKLLSGLPEFCVKDMASWFRFVAVSRPALLQGLQLTPMVDCCVGLLERPDMLPDPLAQSRIVSMLLIFLNSDKRGQGPAASKRFLGDASWSGILGELSIMVQGNPSVRDNLGPALLHTYVAVAIFEGLDVDKENFDKYSTRFEVAQLLQRLWSRPDCKESILRECGSKKFQSFLGAVFDTLLYQLNDALSRLGNVRQCETAIDSGQWHSLPEAERKQKEGFLAHEKRASRGFMTQANLQLDLLLVLSEVASVARCLSLHPLGRRTAASLLGFLNVLCGSKASNLKVKDREKYAFDPVKLVTTISTILIRVWNQNVKNSEEDSFVSCMATHPDFNEGTMNKCLSVLKKNTTDALLCHKFEGFLEQVCICQSPQSLQLMDREGPPNQSEISWKEEADSSIIDQNGLCELYVGSLEESKFDSAELEHSHTLAEKAQVSLDPRSPMLTAVLRDMKQLQEASLIHPDSAIFVRQDEDRLDLVRVMITGPTGTPYSRGCFVFDVNYPASYPTNPPLFIMITTGGGTIRFNPNLYADGKVCLSLLGTWHGGDATEKWDPTQSSLSQVLLSVQGMIFIPDPTFNEPGYEAIRGTQEGNKRSREYNADIQVYTIRYAMTEQLRNPPEGFQDTIPVHFALQRDVILKQCSQWLNEAISSEHKQKLAKAIDQLRVELDKI